MLAETGQGAGSSPQEVLRLTGHLVCPQDPARMVSLHWSPGRPESRGAGRPPSVVPDGGAGAPGSGQQSSPGGC